MSEEISHKKQEENKGNIAENKHEFSGHVVPRLIEQEMKKSYLDYAMSVIVSRALPDVRDGLKPVHRRVLFAMHEMGMTHNKPYKKSARIVGECLGKYHPHGDTAVYDTMVRLAQSWSLRYPLVDGQGNFGSVDGDSPAAMRYTEARLKLIAEEMLNDLKKETVDFQPNFDGSLEEPTVLPAKLPNLLINGTSGIAVGMATNMAPHNLVEVVDGIVHVIDNPDSTIYDLMGHIKGPDFPTGGQVIGVNGIKQAYLTGKGKVLIRARSHIEEKKGKTHIIVTELPYQVNKSNLLEEMANMVRDKIVTGISDLKDESDRDGMRMVITLKKDASPDVVLNQLYKHSRLQVTFGINALALVGQEPRTLNLLELVYHFIDHRAEVVKRRTMFDLKKAEERKHILEGLVIALDNIDAVIELIKAAKSTDDAKFGLSAKYNLSEIQATAILDMKLQKLTNMEQGKIKQELKDLLVLIEELKSILASKQKILMIIKNELLEIKQKFGDARKTELLGGDEFEDIETEDMIKDEDVVVTVTHNGYIKRQSMDTYKTQHRGGKGIISVGTNEEDFVEHLFIASTHSYMLFFTDQGQMHWLKVYKVPDGSRVAKGKALVNLIQLDEKERITAMIPIKDFIGESNLVMVTKQGVIKKCKLDLFSNPRQGGVRAITLDEGDELVNVLLSSGADHIMLATRNGMAVKFHEKDSRSIGRTGRGVRGIRLRPSDYVIGAIICNEGDSILTVCEKGYGKRTLVSEYRVTRRGGVGVTNIKCTDKNGKVIAVKAVKDDNEIMLISQKGIMIRIDAKNIADIGRSTQGVRLMKLHEGDKVMAIAKIVSGALDSENIENNMNTEVSDNVGKPQ